MFGQSASDEGSMTVPENGPLFTHMPRPGGVGKHDTVFTSETHIVEANKDSAGRAWRGRQKDRSR